MKTEKNIQALVGGLLSLGFPAGLERGLRAHLCFGAAQFTLLFRQRRGDDTLKVTLPFQRVEDSSQYRCPFYEARLHRPLDIPGAVVGGIDTRELEARMKEVDWRGCLVSEFTDDPPAPSPPSAPAREEAIERITADLDRLAETPEGAALAHRLKLKFWSDTALEALVPGLSGQRSSQEVGQRFYFFEGEAGITLEEAYRFLCHRWREKQWTAQRKVFTASGAPAPPGSAVPPAKKKGAKESKGKA